MYNITTVESDEDGCQVIQDSPCKTIAKAGPAIVLDETLFLGFTDLNREIAECYGK